MSALSEHSTLLGSAMHRGVSRALSELQARRPVRLQDGDGDWVVLPVDGLNDRRFNEFRSLCSPGIPCMLLPPQRSRAMGIDTSTPMALTIPSGTSAERIVALATDARRHASWEARPAGCVAAAAIRLMKLSRNLPAVLAARMPPGKDDVMQSVVGVDVAAVDDFAGSSAHALMIASDASIPLSSGVSARFVVFRDALGADQVAVIVGKLDLSAPVPVRLHSACLTGDVFGSRRCDCGDQLQLALNRLEGLGGGIILYLAQEGRGIGLANKMRAYRLQDQGFDTHDANTMLGFEDDERSYDVAAAMLHALDCTRIVLLTNNPSKLDGLSNAGVEVCGRIPLEAPVNSHNLRYLTTKARRSGHQLNGLAIPTVNDA